MELLQLAGSQRAQNHVAQRAVERLTPREREVLEALADGHSDRELSERRYVGVGTVRNHVVSIFAKLEVHSRQQALLFARRHGIDEVAWPARSSILRLRRNGDPRRRG